MFWRCALLKLMRFATLHRYLRMYSEMRFHYRCPASKWPFHRRCLQHVPTWTLWHCQNNKLLYFRPTPHGVGTVHMPPVVLFANHQATGNVDFGPAFSTLRVPSISTSPDENKMQTLSAIMHRFRAARLCGHDRIRLSTLLGGVGLGLVEDVLLDIPSCCEVDTRSQQITSDNIVSFCATVRSTAVASPQRTPVAFLNSCRAQYADSIVVLRRFLLLLTGKTAH